GNAIQPGGKTLPLTDRAGLAGKDEERGLEGIVSFVGVAQDLPADAADQRAVSKQQRGEGILIAVDDKAAQQVAVGPVCGGGADHLPEPPQDVGERSVDHVLSPPECSETSPKKERSKRPTDSWALMKIHENVDAIDPIPR